MKIKIKNSGLFYKRIKYNGEPSRYIITNFGWVLNTDKNKIQSPFITNNGYLRVCLSFNGKRKKYLIHRLVAEYFIPNPYNYPEVNHKDGNKFNNKVTNLEWVTAKENVIHSYDHSLNHSGEKNRMSTITNDQCREICMYLERNELTMNEIAKKVGTTRKVVSHIRHKETWTRISKDYDIDNYNVKDKNTIRGESHSSAKIKNKDVKKVCKMIENGKYTLREISEKTGVHYQTVRNIYYRTSWREVSKDFDFSNYRKK